MLLDNYGKMEEGVGNCPVCRKPFDEKDLEHVLDLVGSHSSQLVSYLALLCNMYVNKNSLLVCNCLSTMARIR